MTVLVPLAVAVPLVTAGALVAVGHFVRPRVDDLAGLAAAATAAVLCGILLVRSFGGMLVYWFGGWRPRGSVALGISFSVDPAGAALAVLVAGLVTAALVFAWRYFDATEPLLQVLVLLLLGGLVGMALTGDLFNLFVFFELVSVSAFALTGYRIEEEAPLQGAFNFAVVNSVGAFLILTGIALVYGRTGALNMAQAGEALAGGPVDGLVVTAFVLLTVGFLVKAGIVPFHFWLADAYAVAPSPICVVFAGVMTELGLYAVARVYWTVFSGAVGGHDEAIRAILVGVGVLTALLGGVMAFLQRHLKRMLTYSVISHSGMFLIGIALLSAAGLAGTGLYLAAHGLAVGALFMCCGILLDRAGSVDELALRGKARELRPTAVLWLVATLSLAGPPFVGAYLGHSLIGDDAGALGYSWIAPVLALATILSTAPMLRAWGRVFLGWGPREDDLLTRPPIHEAAEGPRGRSPLFFLLPATVLVVASVAVGIWTGLAGRAEQVAEAFVNRSAYADATLAGRSVELGAVPAVPTTTSGIVWSLVSVLGAVALAAFALWRGRLSADLRARAWRSLQPGLSALRAVHSGHANDYVAWLVLGTAVLGGLFALTFR
jgi:multicomponent Na+:H+ antiporter subunit D